MLDMKVLHLSQIWTGKVFNYNGDKGEIDIVDNIIIKVKDKYEKHCPNLWMQREDNLSKKW